MLKIRLDRDTYSLRAVKEEGDRLNVFENAATVLYESDSEYGFVFVAYTIAERRGLSVTVAYANESKTGAETYTDKTINSFDEFERIENSINSLLDDVVRGEMQYVFSFAKPKPFAVESATVTTTRIPRPTFEAILSERAAIFETETLPSAAKVLRASDSFAAGDKVTVFSAEVVEVVGVSKRYDDVRRYDVSGAAKESESRIAEFVAVRFDDGSTAVYDANALDKV